VGVFVTPAPSLDPDEEMTTCEIPLAAMAAPANRHDSPLPAPTLDALPTLGGLPERVKVHPDRAYDSNLTQRLLQERGPEARTRSSSWGGSSEKRGEATVGRTDLITDHDLLAQALSLIKIGGRVRELFTKVRLCLASGHPGQILWHALSRALGGVHE
jgi:hypothetical protein